jgi:hypothetical protein
MNRIKIARESFEETMRKCRNTMHKFSGRRNDGKSLEEKVSSLLRKEGFRSVELNNRIKDEHGNWSEIDVIGKNRSFKKRWLSVSPHLRWGQDVVYVECKQYNQDMRVSLGDVAKFKEVLTLNKLNIQDGLFVTTTTYVPRASNIGIKTVDRNQLQRWIRYNEPMPKWMEQSFSLSITAGIASYLLFSLFLLGDVHAARTKNLPALSSFENLQDYMSDFRKHTNRGLIYTSGTSVEQRFSLFIGVYYYLAGLALKPFGITYEEPADSIVRRQKQSPIFTKPANNSIYLAYELHRPYPVQQPLAENARKFVHEELKNQYSKHPLWSKLPDTLMYYLNTIPLSFDYVVFKKSGSNNKEEFRISPNDTSYNEVIKDGGSTTLFKIPFPHQLIVPGYMSATAGRLLEKTQKLSSQLLAASPSVLVPLEMAYISSTGSLAMHTDKSGMGQSHIMEERTSQSTYGDREFDHQFRGGSTISTYPTLDKSEEQFVKAMPESQMMLSLDDISIKQPRKFIDEDGVEGTDYSYMSYFNIDHDDDDEC